MSSATRQTSTLNIFISDLHHSFARRTPSAPILRVLLLLALLCAIPRYSNNLQAQNIEIQARVVDSMNMEAVPFATVIFSGTQGTITDVDGFFRYALDGQEEIDSLMVSCVGFNSRQFALADLTPGYLDTLYLFPAFKELDAVDIVEKRKRERSTQKILVDAISKIPENYADQPTVLTGYYREYMKRGSAYINLIESIVELEDPGISKPDSFSVVLLYNKFNRDFPIDSSLVNLYDESTKFVPFGLIPEADFNNLKILRFADPIRNFKDKSVSHFNEFRDDFINNHTFENRKLTYVDGQPYYFIKFTDDVFFTYGQAKVRMVGEMYINADDYAIKNLKYTAILDHGFIREKLFEISLEYIKVGEKYYLHYISHNNLFKHKNFNLIGSKLRRGRLMLDFSSNPATRIAADPGNYVVEVNGFEQPVDMVETRKNRITITFADGSVIENSDPSNVPIFKLGKRMQARRNLKEIRQNMTLELNNLVSEYGSPLANETYSNYYQYRELFVKDRNTDTLSADAPRLDLSKPMLEARVAGNVEPDTTWINTPLITEELRETRSFSRIPLQNEYVQHNYRKLMSGTNDLVYIHTDREVYAPEDTLWFKGYVRNSLLLTPSDMSQGFFVKLIDADGEVIESKKYLVQDSDVHGEFVLDHSLEPGFYSIVGYSSWMKNFDNEALFRKQFMVRSEKRPGPGLFVECDREVYYPGDLLNMRIHLKDAFNRDLPGEQVRYEISDASGELLSGRIETRAEDYETVPFILPNKLASSPEIRVWCNYQSNMIDTTYQLPVKARLDVSFYPEGGRMVSGIDGRVALLAVSSDGIPAAIAGTVIDAAGKVVTEVSTSDKGMGIMEIRPEEGNPLSLVVREPAVLSDTFALPRPVGVGWSLQVEQGRRDLSARVIHTFGRDRDGLLAVTVRGSLVHYEAFQAYRRTTLDIPLDQLPPGVAVITLFDEQMLPQAERLVYVAPRTDYLAKIRTYRQTYLPRDSVEMKIRVEALGRLHNGSYSISIMDDFLGSTRQLNEPCMATSLLMSDALPEVAGELNNYIDVQGRADQEAIELLLLTRGWRSYSVEPEGFKMPTDQDAVTGRLGRVRGGREPEPIEGEVTVYFGGNTTTLETRSDGSFSFTPDFSGGSNTDVFVSATDTRGRNNNVSIFTDSTDFEKQLEGYLRTLGRALDRTPIAKPETYYTFSDHYRYGAENMRWLEEVVVRKTVEQEDLILSDYAAFSRSATPEQLEQAIDLEHMRQLLRVPNPFNYTLWYSIDGQLQTRLEQREQNFPIEVPDSTIVETIDPSEIKNYTVVYGPEAEALYGIGKFYVIDIETTDREDRDRLQRGRNPLVIGKFEVAKEFFSPKYDTQMKRDNPFPDLRKTIYWDPSLKVDENGFATVKFYNGDRYTRIRCIMEGVTTDGIPVHGEHTYNIGTMRE